MKKVLLCVNLRQDPRLDFTERITRRLMKRGAEVTLHIPFRKELDRFPEFAPVCEDFEEALRETELLITLGGDGTMLRVANPAARHGVPMLGINIGHMGFITELEQDELESLDPIFEGKYIIEQRMMLDVELYREGKLLYHDFGLNEAVIACRNPSHSIRLTAYGDERKISDYAGDGIIIATPTGSTAYSMAAGGPIVEPTAENLILTPICAHSLTAKAYVLTGDRVTSVRLLRTEEGSTVLMVDGGEGLPLQEQDMVYVRKSAFSTQLVKLKDKSFYDIVKNKLNQ